MNKVSFLHLQMEINIMKVDYIFHNKMTLQKTFLKSILNTIIFLILENYT
jgi:hypothetical protein